MIVVAGPPGSGKSSRFPLSSYHVDWFNADDRAAELTLGSFRKISTEIRAKVSAEFQRWILDHISARKSFAVETTLRSPITFDAGAPSPRTWLLDSHGVRDGRQGGREHPTNYGALISRRTLRLRAACRGDLRKKHEKSSHCAFRRKRDRNRTRPRQLGTTRTRPAALEFSSRTATFRCS
jgi:hypothetical protein